MIKCANCGQEVPAEGTFFLTCKPCRIGIKRQYDDRHAYQLVIPELEPRRWRKNETDKMDGAEAE